MNKTTIMNNVVPHETIRKIQQDVLDKLSMILKQSFGPMGSNTVIKKENALNVYTKDGHTILSNIYFHGIIEQSIKDDIETITRHIVTTVGDGTTSGVMMSAFIYRAINEISDKFNLPPVQTLEYFNDIVNSICTRIKKKAQDCALDDIYDICMISTNGNEFISGVIRDIYRDYGNEVFIDVAAGIDENTAIKAYDGMTINTGFVDPCFVTDTSKNECVIDAPSIYFFSDPIDTKEMAVMLDAILSKNIVAPYNEIARGNAGSIIPTVIVAPKISRDLSSLMNKIIQLMNQLPAGEKLPLLIITDYHQIDEVEDIAKLCNAPFIHKYIDPKILEEDVEAGLAPTPDTIETFCGHCEQIVSSSFKTSFINPIDMKNEDGSYTTTYNNLLSFLETSLSKAKENGEDAHAIGTLKRRIHSLRSNLVEVSVGGISPTDRDALRDLVEDAVKKIYLAKGRDFKNPINLLVDSMEMIESVAKNISPLEYALMEAFFPGPFTIILEKQEVVPDIVTAGQSLVGVRMPSGVIAKKLVEYASVPIAAPSANISGKVSGTSFKDILEDFKDKVDCAIDGGNSEIGIESTIVKVIDNVPHILRPGSITEEQILQFAPAVIKDYEDENSTNVNHANHYTPNSNCVLVYSKDNKKMVDEINKISSKYSKPCILSTHENLSFYSGNTVIDIGSKSNLNEIARNIFSCLKKADSFSPDIVIIEGVEQSGIGAAIMNRLLKS